MKLFGALEDFVNETLAQLPSRLGKLQFISEMRSKGRYQHWGLSKRYGEEAVQRAIAEAHADIFEDTLTTPIPELAGESQATNKEPTIPFLNPCGALPTDLRGGTERHFKWVLKVVDLLHHSHRRPNPSA